MKSYTLTDLPNEIFYKMIAKNILQDHYESNIHTLIALKNSSTTLAKKTLSLLEEHFKEPQNLLMYISRLSAKETQRFVYAFFRPTSSLFYHELREKAKQGYENPLALLCYALITDDIMELDLDCFKVAIKDFESGVKIDFKRNLLESFKAISILLSGNKKKFISSFTSQYYFDSHTPYKEYVNMASLNLVELLGKIQQLSNFHCRYVDFRYANLEKVNLKGFSEKSNCSNIYLDLTNSNLREANLQNAKFSNLTNIDGANLQYANLMNCSLPIAMKQAPDLRHAILIGSHPYFNSWAPNPKLEGAKFFRNADFKTLEDFSNALNQLIFDLYLFNMTSAQIELFREAIVSDLLIRYLPRIFKERRTIVLQKAYDHPLFAEQHPIINAVNTVATKIYAATKFNFFKPIESKAQEILREAIEGIKKEAQSDEGFKLLP